MWDIPFLLTTLFLLYIYVGYPALLAIFAKVFPTAHKVDPNFEPTVTLVISAFNEEGIIGAKLENSLALRYPKEKLGIVVVSDCSSDRTDEIVRSYASRGVRLLPQGKRRGKTSGLNMAMGTISSTLVIFSDANALYEPHAVRRLVRHFADEKVGYVVGRAVYQGQEATSAGTCENLYWGLETRIKSWESDFSSVVGGDGAIYAIRSRLYEPLRETDISDFVNPLQIVSKGYRGLFEPEAVCRERPAGDFSKEFGRKVRIVNRSFNGLLRVSKICNPFRFGRFSWQVVSHKLLKWCSPFILAAHFLLAFLSSGETPIGVAAYVTLVLYGLAASAGFIGGLQEPRTKAYKRFFHVPYYFALVMVASAVGILMRLQGVVLSVWSPAREDSKGASCPNGRVLSLLGFITTLSSLRLVSLGLSLISLNA